MRAWIVEKFEGLEHMSLADLPDPAAGAGEVVGRGACKDVGAPLVHANGAGRGPRRVSV